MAALKSYELKLTGINAETCIRFARFDVHVIGALQDITLQKKSQHSENNIKILPPTWTTSHLS